MTVRTFCGLMMFLAGLLMAILGWAYFENHVLIAIFLLTGIFLMDLGSDHRFLKLKRRRFRVKA